MVNATKCIWNGEGLRYWDNYQRKSDYTRKGSGVAVQSEFVVGLVF